jgi:hypothetical protein
MPVSQNKVTCSDCQEPQINEGNTRTYATLLGREATRKVNTNTAYKVMKKPAELLYSTVSVPP